jgi:hypothetical protein
VLSSDTHHIKSVSENDFNVDASPNATHPIETDAISFTNLMLDGDALISTDADTSIIFRSDL